MAILSASAGGSAPRSSRAVERLALHELHDQERDAGLFADVVKRADVRMVERRDGAGLTIEALAELRIGGQRFGQDLDRDGAIETCVARAIDLAHPTGAQRRDELVRAQARAGLQGHRY